MTEYERARRIGELRLNLLVFDTPGFSRVMMDLQRDHIREMDVDLNLQALKSAYRRELQELEDNIDSKYKQGKLL